MINSWSEKVAEDFLKETELKIAVLKQFPEIGRQSTTDKNIRKVKVAKHPALYYRATKHKLELLGFFDQRQNPLKKKY